MNTQQLKYWAKEAHALSASNGFWEEKNGKPYRDLTQALNLIIEEIGELHTARRGMRFLYQPLLGQPEKGAGIPIEWAREFMSTYMKDTFEEELADIALRVFDLIGGMALIYGEEAEEVLMVQFSPRTDYSRSYDEMMMELTRHVCSDAFYQNAHVDVLAQIILLLKIVRITEFIAENTYHTPARTTYNLSDLMHIKHAYNKGRERKHGKQY